MKSKIYNKIAIAIFEIIILLLLSCKENDTIANKTDQIPISNRTNPIFNSVGYRLASIEAGYMLRADDPSILDFQIVLNNLSAKFVEDSIQISDATVTIKKILDKKGIEESMLRIMEGINNFYNKPIENQKYAEYAAAYATLRINGSSHQNAILDMQSFMRSLRAK